MLSRHMAINDVLGRRVYHVRDILRKFLGHNFASGLCILKPIKNKNLKTFSNNLGFFQPWLKCCYADRPTVGFM